MDKNIIKIIGLIVGLIALVAIILFVLIGLSRIAEGRHYATDVLGGWSLGIAYFTLCVIWYEYREKLFKKNRST